MDRKRSIPFGITLFMEYTSNMRREEEHLEKVLRGAMKQSGLSTYALAAKSGVPQAVIVRFMNRQRGINLRTASKLFRALGLTVNQKTKL